MNNYYQPSGKFSVSSFIYFMIACVVAFPILGALYAYAIWYIPLVYTGLFGFTIAWVTNKFVIKQGKVRNV